MCKINAVRLASVLLFMVLAACGVALAACRTVKGWVYTCEHPDHPVPGDIGPDGQPDPCHRRDAGVDTGDDGLPASLQCRGDCVPPNADSNWSMDPVLLWHGDAAQLPDTCPGGLESEWVGGDKPVLPGTCPRCVCDSPACALPSGVIASTQAGCNGPLFTPLASSPDGSCSLSKPIQPNEFGSLALAPPTVGPCAARIEEVEAPKFKDIHVYDGWSIKGRVCVGAGVGFCDANHVCVPAAEGPPARFRHCIARVGPFEDDTKVECDNSLYPDKKTLYEDVDTSIGCSACGCEPPVGSDCVAAVSAYQSESCAPESALFENYYVSLSGPVCAGIPPNVSIQGVTAKLKVDQPGTCKPTGGGWSGHVEPDHKTAHIYCCQKMDPG